MNRKSFFRAFVPAGLAALLIKDAMANPVSDTPSSNITPGKVPPYLKHGDTVAITCPAGSVEVERMYPCARTLNKWGLHVKYGKTVGKKWQRFGGTDQERLADFQALLDDPSISAIIFGKGGYGTMRIIDELNWEKFQQHPKWLVGYSDLTVVHMHVHTNFQIPTIHGDMGIGFTVEDASSRSLYNALFGTKAEYHLKSESMNRTGTAIGQIVGGNLTLVHACAASKSELDTTGKILFIEDVSEFKYTIDRMLMSLKRSGKLDNLAGLVVGQFTGLRHEAEETFKMRVEDIIWDKVKEYDYPVCFNFPSGHIAQNRALKMGVPFALTVGREWVTLTEQAIPAYAQKIELEKKPLFDSTTLTQQTPPLTDTTIVRR